MCAHRRESSQFGLGVPTTVVAEFVGQIYFDTVNAQSYVSRSKTAGDWVLLGSGDMTKSIYDIDENSIVDKAETLDDGTNSVTAAEVRTHLDDLSIHRELNDANISTTELWSSDKIESEIASAVTGVSVDLPVVQSRRTTTLSGATAWTDVTLDTTDIENNTTVIEHDNVNTDRLLIKDTGLYLIGYTAEISPDDYPSTLEGRVRVNDSSIIAQSVTLVEEDQEITNFNSVCTVELVAGDYITLQIRTSVVGDIVQAGAALFAIRQRGSKGDTGATGAPGGTTVDVEQDDSVVSSNIGTINFEGNVTVIDEGGSKVTVQLDDDNFQFVESNAVVTTTSTTFTTKIDWDTSGLLAGDYLVEWSYGWAHDSQSTDLNAILVLDDDFDNDDLVMQHFQEPKDAGGVGIDRHIGVRTNQKYMLSGFRVLTLSAGTHNFKLQFRTTVAGEESSMWNAIITLRKVG